MTDPTPADRLRAIALLEAADWFTREGRMVQRLFGYQVAALLRRRADDADPMVGSLARDGFGADEIAAMLRPEPAAVPPADRAAEMANLRTMYDAASAREHELIEERDKLVRWHREDEAALAKMRGTIERLRSELKHAQQPPADRAAVERVRTVLEMEAVVGRSALEYRGLIASALMAAEEQRCPHGCDVSRCPCLACEAEQAAEEQPATKAEAPRPDITTLAAALDGLHTLIATSSRDWQTYRVDAWLWAVLCGWDCEQAEHDDTCTHGALEETAAMHGWDADTVAKVRRYRAAVRALTDTAAEAQPATEAPCCSDPTCACVQVTADGRCACARWESSPQQPAAGARQDGAQQESDNQRTVCVCGHTRGEHIRIGGPFGQGRLLCDTCDPDSTENLTCKEFEAL